MRIVESGSVTLKAALIGVIVLLLLVPLAMLKSVVTERAGLREQAYQRVAEGWGGELTVGGPMLIVPTERIVQIDGKERRVRNDVYLLPAKLSADLDVKLDPEPRYVGIYAVPVYLSTVRLQGEFDFTKLQPISPDFSLDSGTRILWSQSRLRLPLSSVGSLREIKQASFAGGQIKLGPPGPGMFPGIEAWVDLSQLYQTPGASFDFDAVIAGSRAVSVLPLGSVTSVKLSADWPHPSFQGSSLPVERNIADTGFEARWQVLELNRAYGEIWREGNVTEEMLSKSAVGVSLFQPVDIYQRGERAVKYAVLFIALTFLTFFAWEQVTRNRLHPLQYLLVGLALSMFYLLLIALSEHIAFAIAYVTAAAALVLLIGLYLAGALRSAWRGAIAGGAMSLVYGLLYVLVLSENYSLLLGSIILFAALAAVMLATRRVDWYRLRPEEPSQTEESYQ
ncbi:cell envelope integrity protein CreD [Steroidobacter agaridevorans]|uniref:cell envelope integrity protein CreD n=1 Tax=Steroidobacter agaridevorans TaxID=2695856 RepID=UPI0013243814|nr:cell envelope integrity protein CreD [Steroidobacter agaridevorans]GFE86599.1 cell envelope integrity protein CreD [Steroidobacter agaridevorans]